MERSELLSLIREDYQRYEKLEGRKSGICKKIGRAFFMNHSLSPFGSVYALIFKVKIMFLLG